MRAPASPTSRPVRRLALAVALGLLPALGLATMPARAQVPPSPIDVALYEGLLSAVANKRTDEVRRLLDAGANPNQRDIAGRTALHIAAHMRAADIVRLLVDKGADVRAFESQRYDAITIAAVNDNAALVKLLIQLGGDPRAITSPYAGTALIAAAHLGNDNVVRELVAAGAPIDHVNNLGWTALLEAVILGDGGFRHQTCVRILLEAGANASLPDRNGATPLGHARKRGYASIAALIEKAGGKP
jgi:ankyrin repeat protein